MKRLLLFAAFALAVVCLSVPAYAETAPSSDSPLVTLKDRADKFREDPTLYESGKVSLKFGLDTRFRLISYTHGDNQMFGPVENADTYVTFRNLVSLDFAAGDSVQAFLEIVDARVGSYPDDEPSYLENSLDIHQFWLELHPVNWPLALRVGRQYLQIGDGLLIGHSDWDQTPQVFDGVKFTFKGEDVWSANIFVGLPVWPDNNNFDQATYHEDPTFNDDFAYIAIWGDYKFMEELSMGAFVIMKQDSNAQTQGEDGLFEDWRSYTYGVRGYGNLYGFDYSVTIALQGGNHGTDDIEAYGYDIRAKYAFEYAMNPKIWGSYTFASGDDNGLDGEYHSFDPLIGDRADRFGRIQSVGMSNSQIFGFGGSIEPIENLTVKLDFFHYSRNERNDAWYDQRGNQYATGVFEARTLGSEIDLAISYQLEKWTVLTFGYATMFGCNMLDDLGLDDNASMLYFTIQMKF